MKSMPCEFSLSLQNFLPWDGGELFLWKYLWAPLLFLGTSQKNLLKSSRSLVIPQGVDLAGVSPVLRLCAG